MAEAETKKRHVIASTDLSKWRLKNERGRQTWWYDAKGEFERDSNFAELHSLGLDTVRYMPRTMTVYISFRIMNVYLARALMRLCHSLFNTAILRRAREPPLYLVPLLPEKPLGME